MELLSSLNKISLVAFLITLVFLIYQFYSFKKEITVKKGKPVVPDFKGNITNPVNFTKVIVNEKQASFKKPSRLPLIIGVILVLVFGGVFIFGLLSDKFPNPLVEMAVQTVPTPQINLVVSKGIQIFDPNWMLLSDTQLSKLSAGQTIYIGLATINNAGIDQARIRVNQQVWTTDDITLDFNKANDVYYKKYTISTGTASLKIDAQLHSSLDGWLGD